MGVRFRFLGERACLGFTCAFLTRGLMCARRSVSTTILGQEKETWQPQCSPLLSLSPLSKDVSVRLVSASKIILCTA